jgi:hypothetical protein
LRFHFGRRRQASDAAGRLRGRRWWGVNPGDPEVYLWGAPVELNKTDWVKVVRDRLINQLGLNAFEMSPTRMDDYLEAIQQYQPRCVYGYASSLALLAAHAQSRRWPLRLPRLAVVCTTGEPLFEHQRQLIGEVFGAPVANEFGSRDIGFTAHDSPSGQMLLATPGGVGFCGCDSSAARVPSPRSRTTRPARSMKSPPPRSSANAGVAATCTIEFTVETSTGVAVSGSVMVPPQPTFHTSTVVQKRRPCITASFRLCVSRA